MATIQRTDQRARFLIALVIILTCLTILRGCSVVSGFRQIVTVRVSNSETDEGVVGVEVTRIHESDTRVSGETFLSGADGLAELVERIYVPCGFSFGADSCGSADYEDEVTGTIVKYFVGDGQPSDIIEIELREGNVEVGERYTIEVISISEPLDLNSD